MKFSGSSNADRSTSCQCGWFRIIEITAWDFLNNVITVASGSTNDFNSWRTNGYGSDHPPKQTAKSQVHTEFREAIGL